MPLLEELEEASLILHVVDISHPKAEEHASVVNRLLKRLGHDRKPSILVLNKIDLAETKYGESVEQYFQRMIDSIPYHSVIPISASHKLGLQKLIEFLLIFLKLSQS